MTAPSDPSIDKMSIARDSLWHAHRFDAATNAFQFRRVDREAHRAAPFLTDEYLGEADRLVPVDADMLDRAEAPRAPLHFIFHSAFCASTMALRAMDLPGVAMGLSEPMLCNDLMGWIRRGGDRRAAAQALDRSLALLARPFGAGEAVVVKPSNIFNPMIAACLSLRQDSRAVLLHAPLEVFLASVARKGLWCRLWARELLEGQIQDGMVQLGFETRDYFRQTDLQVAAVGWLAQHRLFHDLLTRFGPDRLRSLDSETLVADKIGSLGALARHFGLDASDVNTRLADQPALQKHSKFGQEFNTADREAEARQALSAHGDELEKVGQWARAVADAHGIALSLPHPLIA